jgi:hypothetical protein
MDVGAGLFADARALACGGWARLTSIIDST